MKGTFNCSRHLRNSLIRVVLLIGTAVIVLFAEPSDPNGWQEAIKNVEKRQEIVLEGMKNYYQYGLWFLGSMTALVALLSLIRHVQDQRFIKLQEQQIADAKELGKSYKVSIDAANSLMVAFKNAVDQYQEAQKAVKTVSDLAAQQQKESSHWESQMRSLNDRAIAINRQCRRNSHNDPEIQRQVREFAAHYELLSRSFETSEQLNANGRFLLALHARIENRYDDAIAGFEDTISLAENHKVSSSTAYRTLPAGVGVSDWLTKLQNICAFHKAILENNLGLYSDALRSFEGAMVFDSMDYQSLSYIPEVMFLGGLAVFSKVLDTFERAIEKVEKLPPGQSSGFSLSRERLLAILHLKLANCYMAESQHSDYREHRDPVKAEYHIEQSRSFDSNFAFSDLARAQLLAEQDRNLSERNDLFQRVFQVTKDIVSRTTETKILMMDYYIMMICCALGDLRSELPSVYAMRVYELVPKLPEANRIRIFSPRSKTDLTVNEFIAELKAFESGPRSDSGLPTRPLQTISRQTSSRLSSMRGVPRYR